MVRRGPRLSHKMRMPEGRVLPAERYMMARMRLHARLLLLSLAAAAACAGPRFKGPALADLRGPESRCRAGVSNPLVTEWPASEKANLEALLKGGAVAVEYAGCSMRVLTQCRLGGKYAWLRTTPASDVVEIEDEDQLYAKLPLGAVSLEGELKRSGKLTIHTYVAGQMRLEGAAPADVPAAGECARATHVVSALAVGAFSLSGTGKVGGKADVSVTKLGSAGGRSDRSAGLVRSAGDWQACGQGSEAAPHANCRSPIQAFLWRIPGRGAEEGPAGTVKVDLVSANASTRWDVYYDDAVICTTPCSRWLDPARPLMFRTRDDGRFGSERIQVRDLAAHAAAGAVQVQAHATSNGELVTGITFTTFGGMALITGIALTAIGCGGGDHASSGLCTGGLVAFGAGAATTAASISLILDSLPKAEIRPWGPAGGTISVAAGPGFVAGRF